MRRIPKGKIVLAAAAVLLLAAALVTAFAPMADRGRAQADYITELSAENWVASQVYEDGGGYPLKRPGGRRAVPFPAG